MSKTELFNTDDPSFRKTICSLSIAISILLSASVSSQEDPPVAIINGYTISTSDVDKQITTMPLGDQVVVRANPEKFAESLIQEEVLFQFVLKDQFSEDPELREQLKTLAVNHLIDKYVTKQVDVTDAEVQQYYDNNTSAIRGETIQISHILTETQQQCEELKTRLDNGEPFADLATAHSIHERSAPNGGALGSIMNHDGPLGFEQQLFDLPENQHTIFQSDEGCHIMVVTGRDTPELPEIEVVAPALRGLLEREQEIAALQALIEKAHSAVTVIRPE